MMTTNKLTKTFASGLATLSIAAVAGIVNAPSTHAQQAGEGTYSIEALIGGLTVQIDDKLFSDFSISGGVDLDDEVDFSRVADTWIVQFDAGAGANEELTTLGTLGYKVTITDPDYVFKSVELDSDVLEPFEVTKDINEDLLTLTSTDGSNTGFVDILDDLTTIDVLDTFTPGDGGVLLSASNKFRQRPVPEPSTILGLLAVGGLGMVSRFKKQK